MEGGRDADDENEVSENHDNDNVSKSVERSERVFDSLALGEGVKVVIEQGTQHAVSPTLLIGHFRCLELRDETLQTRVEQERQK